MARFRVSQAAVKVLVGLWFFLELGVPSKLTWLLAEFSYEGVCVLLGFFSLWYVFLVFK